MKKHIIGLALFSFIVSIAAVAYALFPVPEIAPVSETITFYQNNSTNLPTSCWKMKRQSKESVNLPAITQAVFNPKTKKLSWKGELSNIGNITYLHFWAVDEKGLHYIDSISAENLRRGERVVTSDWQDLNLRKISSQTNLYLIADTFAQSFENETEYHPKFDMNNAIPVTIDYGK